MKRTGTFAALAMTLLASSALAAENNDWMVRVRALGVIPDESSTITPVGGEASVDNSVVPEVDVTYFFTPNIAAELIAATTPHDVTAKGTAVGNVDAGSAWLLPPTLTVQYHFTNLGDLKPYIGAGVNYTLFYNEDAGAFNSVKYDDSFGPALQAGIDYHLKDNWYLNLDVKKVWINTNASFNNGAVRADVDIDPWLIGVGVGYRF